MSRNENDKPVNTHGLSEDQPGVTQFVESSEAQGVGLTVAAPSPVDKEVIHAKEADVPVEWNVGDKILDLYEVKAVHTGGGMGLVYRVHHTGWNLDLAVKSPRQDYFKTQEQKDNFVRECETWIDLGLHPNTVSCFYVRTLGDIPRVFAEYVEGGNLSDWIKSRKLYEGGHKKALERILDIAIQFAWGLHYAHEKGLIHQDVKPANVMMTPDGTAKVTDFGLTKARGMTGERDAAVPGKSVLASVGGMTPAYCSPEQARATAESKVGVTPVKLTRRTDIWSWGLSVFEMFTGEVTWQTGQAAAEVLESYLEMGAMDEVRPQMPEDLVHLLKHCFQPKPDDRPKDMQEIVFKLQDAYKQITGSEYTREEPKAADLLADGLNNKALSYLDLGRKDDAIKCWQKALEINQTHLEATYNLSLIQWRTGKIADDVVLLRLDNCGNSPSTDREKLAELKSFIYAERMDLEGAKEVLQEFSGRYHTLFAGKDSGEIGWVRTLEGHTDKVTSVALTPDGRHAVSSSHDKTLRVWEIATGRCIRILEGHEGPVNSVTLTTDGRFAVSRSGDGTLRVWEIASGRCVRTLEMTSSFSDAITPDGRHVVSGSMDKTLRVWELASGRCVQTLEGDTKRVQSIVLSPDGRHAISGRKDRTVRVWELATGRCVCSMEGHYSSVQSVALTPDGRHVVSGSMDKTLRVWELAKGQCIRTLEGHSKMVASVALTPDGRFAVSRSMDETLRVWELASGRCIRTLKKHTDMVISLALSPNSGYVVLGHSGKTLRVWNITSDRLYVAELMLSLPKGFKEIKKEEDTLEQAVNQASALFGETQYNNSFSILYEAWKETGFKDNDSVKKLYSRLLEKGKIKGLKFSFQKDLLIGHTDKVTSVALTPDGRHAVSSSHDKALRVWEIATGRCIRILEGHKGAVNSVTITPDGRHVVSGSDDSTLLVWELATGRCISTMTGHKIRVSSVCITPDGRHVVSGSYDKTLRVWELATGRCIRTLKGHAHWVWSAALAPSGRHAISASSDKTVRMWDLVTGDCIHTFEAHPERVFSVSVTPDGRYAVSGSADATLRVIELLTGKSIHVLEGHIYQWRPDICGVLAVAFSPDGRYAISGSSDKTLRMWDFVPGRCINTLEGHTDDVLSVTFTPDGRYAVSAGADKTLRVWELVWDLEFPEPLDWDEGARPYLDLFLTLYRGQWGEEEFKQLLDELSSKRGYGWLRPEGIRKELVEMTKEWKPSSKSHPLDFKSEVDVANAVNKDLVTQILSEIEEERAPGIFEIEQLTVKGDKSGLIALEEAIKIKSGNFSCNFYKPNTGIVSYSEIDEAVQQILHLAKERKLLQNISEVQRFLSLILVKKNLSSGYTIKDVVSSVKEIDTDQHHAIQLLLCQLIFSARLSKEPPPPRTPVQAIDVEQKKPPIVEKTPIIVMEEGPGRKHVQKRTVVIIVIAALLAGLLGGVFFKFIKPGPEVTFHSEAPKQEASLGEGVSGTKPAKIAMLETETSQNPKNLKAWIELGNRYFDTEQNEKAIYAYKKYLELDVGNANVWSDLGIMYRRTGNSKEAIKAFDRAIEMDPGHETSRFNKGIVLIKDMGDPEGALKAWEDLLRINPSAKAPNGQPVMKLVQRIKERPKP